MRRSAKGPIGGSDSPGRRPAPGIIHRWKLQSVEGIMTEWRLALVPAPEPGTKATGHVDWRDEALLGWEWPYVAVRGREDGPALLVTAGVHAAEYPAIDAAVRFTAAVDPSRLRGQ